MKCLPALLDIHDGDEQVALSELEEAIENFCYDTNGLLDDYQSAVRCLQEISLEPDYLQDFIEEVNARPETILKYQED